MTTSTPQHFVLISCSASKLDHAAPAGQLYTSALFRKSLHWAKLIGATPLVLSAKHGLIAIDTVIEPYDLKLTQLNKRQRNTWAELVHGQALKMIPAGSKVSILAGKAYVEPLMACKSYYYPAFTSENIELPLAGLQIGERLRALNTMVDDALYENHHEKKLDDLAALNTAHVNRAVELIEQARAHVLTDTITCKDALIEALVDEGVLCLAWSYVRKSMSPTHAEMLPRLEEATMEDLAMMPQHTVVGRIAPLMALQQLYVTNRAKIDKIKAFLRNKARTCAA